MQSPHQNKTFGCFKRALSLHKQRMRDVKTVAFYNTKLMAKQITKGYISKQQKYKYELGNKITGIKFKTS